LVQRQREGKWEDTYTVMCQSFQRITESLRWEKTSKITVNPTPPCLLNRVPRCHFYTVFEPLQGWGTHHCPGQPVPMPDHSFSKKIFPNLQSKPALTQAEARTTLCTTACINMVIQVHQGCAAVPTQQPLLQDPQPQDLPLQAKMLPLALTVTSLETRPSTSVPSKATNHSRVPP